MKTELHPKSRQSDSLISPILNETPERTQVKQFLKKIRDIVLLPLIASSLIIGFAPFRVTAQNLCDQPVVDEAGVFNNRTGEVESAAKRLVSSGADVRVRTITTYGPTGNLDRFEADLEKQ